MLNNLKPIKLAQKITELSGIDVFKNNRERKVVEVRSLLTYLLRDKLKMRWKNIVLFYDHNSELIKLQSQFLFDPDISHDEIDKISYLEKKCKRLEKKIQEQTNK